MREAQKERFGIKEEEFDRSRKEQDRLVESVKLTFPERGAKMARKDQAWEIASTTA